MRRQDKSTPQQSIDTAEQAQKDLERIRTLLVGPELERYQAAQQANKENEISEVITQAIHLREQKDKSVSSTIAPMVQDTVKEALISQRQEFTDYMFPLVGDLVRKYVYASMRDLIERTNKIIESSVSFKGLVWRFKALRAGISFAQYVISQTYVFRVEQVLLIHQEAGILLNAASRQQNDEQHSELVSAMLTAINDFVSDSFSASVERGEQRLDEIKTDNLTLFLIRGPKAMLVAAVNGNISPEAKRKLQESVDNIHKRFHTQLEHFEGDTETFIESSKTLKDCLLEEEKASDGKKKTPIFALLAIFLIACVCMYVAFLHWQTNQALARLQSLPTSEAIVPISIEKNGIHDIQIKALRGADALPLEQWAQQADVSNQWLNFQEYPYSAASNTLFEQQITYLLSQFPQVQYIADENRIAGSVSPSEFDQISALANFINSLGAQFLNLDTLRIQLVSDAQSLETLRIGFEQLANEISQYQIDFVIGESNIAAREFGKLELLAERFKTIQNIAKQIDEQAYLLIIGSSDNSGSQSSNIALSLARADTVAKRLVSLGISAESILQTGVLPIDTEGKEANARKALVTVIHSSQLNKDEN